MVIIGGNRHFFGKGLHAAAHFKPVRAFGDFSAEFAHFGCHRVNAVRFLHAPGADAGQPHLPPRFQRHRHERHGGVRDERTVRVNPLENAVCRGRGLNEVFALHNPRAHHFQKVRKGRIPLKRILADPDNAHGAARQGA